MTKEELKTDESKYIIELVIKDKLRKEAEEWLCNNLHSASEEDFIKAMVDIAEPREKQIAELSKHIVELQNDKGELIDRCRELEAQIEKMKCCYNCKHFDFNEPNYCHKGVYRERQYVCSELEFGN